MKCMLQVCLCVVTVYSVISHPSQSVNVQHREVKGHHGELKGHNRYVKEFMFDMYKNRVEGRTTDDFDFVMSFENQEVNLEGDLTFDLSHLKSEDVLKAVLKLYKVPVRSQKRYQLSVYQRSANASELLSTVFVSGQVRGWVDVKVTEMVRTHRGQVTLEIKVTDQQGKQMPRDVIGLTEAPAGDRQPFVVAYLRAPVVQRHRRDAEITDGGCGMQSITIDLREVLGDWVVAPSTLDTGYCSGVCVEPASPTHMPGRLSSLHQFMSTSCCRPTATTPITILYFDEAGRLVMQTVDNLVVESCGCV